MTVNDRQEEVIVLSQVFFNPADDHGAVGIANLFGDHANGVGPLQAQSSREEVWPVVQRLCCFNNAVLGVVRDGTCSGGVVQGSGNRARSKTEVIGNGFKSDSRFGAKGLLLPRRLGHLRDPPGIYKASLVIAIFWTYRGPGGHLLLSGYWFSAHANGWLVWSITWLSKAHPPSVTPHPAEIWSARTHPRPNKTLALPNREPGTER